MHESPAARMQREKERARGLLAEGYAADHIDQAELDRRLDAVERATSVETLLALTEELRPAPRGGPLVPAPAAERLPVVFSSIDRRGPWAVAPRTLVRSIFGSATLDLRLAVLPGGPVEIEVDILFGGVDIIVPPGWRIDNRTGAFLGGVEQDEASVEPTEDAQVLVIRGRVILGGLSVFERLPGEGKVAAWRRRKEARKALAERARRALPGGER